MKPVNRLIVKVSTSVFKQGNRYIYQKSLTPVKRKSTLTMNDVMSDLESELPQLFSAWLEDGLYELTATDFSRDWETGVIDNWNLILIPWVEKE